MATPTLKYVAPEPGSDPGLEPEPVVIYGLDAGGVGAPTLAQFAALVARVEDLENA